MKSNELREILETILIFLIMGILSVIAKLQKSESKLNLREKFNIFYVNTVAGWGLFSLLVSYKDWFGNYPQKVFTIMTVVYVGFNVLEYIKRQNIVGKFIEFIINNKK